MMLKADLHIHTHEDPEDWYIEPTAKEAIDYAAQKGFKVLAITNHGAVTYDKEIVAYAKKKGILLIPGVEAYVCGKHTLLYNFTQEEVSQIKDFKDLAKFKTKNKLVIAPHTFYFHPDIKHLSNHGLFGELKKNVKLFDAIEFCHFYLGFANFNASAEAFARRRGLPLIANSDAHALWMMNSNFTMIDAEPTIKSVIDAIKRGRVRIVSRPRTLKEFFKIAYIELFH